MTGHSSTLNGEFNLLITYEKKNFRTLGHPKKLTTGGGYVLPEIYFLIYLKPNAKFQNHRKATFGRKVCDTEE